MMKRDGEISCRDEAFWELALAVNAAFKGILGAMGQSGHICARTIALEGRVAVECGWGAVKAHLAAQAARALHDGDVLVVAEKVVAAAEGWLGPRSILRDPDPKTVSADERKRLAERLSRELGFDVSPLHLLLADEYPGDRATLGAADHNRAAYELATELATHHARRVDVVISDTDTGLDVREPLIGTLTLAATPLGATAGVNLYEAMRCAVAAEFVRGHDRLIPAVICVPADRRRARTFIGEARGYPGALDARRESGIAHA
jgi:hypothetical protein